MKNLVCLVISILLLPPCLAQSPYVFNYQGLARDGQGVALVNQEISVLISIISGFEEGPLEFQEEHVVTTSDHGIFNLAIGDGDFLTGNLRNIDWGSDQFFIRTEIDPAAGENYIDLGAAQLFSVPFALYALESGSGGGGGSQELFFDGENLSISNGNTVDLSTLGSGAQTLSINGDQLSISGGNTISLPVTDPDPQTLSIDGDQLSISGGNSVSLPVTDPDPQTLSIDGDQLSISNGNSITLPSGGGMSPWIVEGNDISYTDGKVGVNLLSLSDNEDELITMRGVQNPKAGYLSINDIDNPVVELSSDEDANGLIGVYSNRGAPLIGLEGTGDPVSGSFRVFNSDGDMVVWAKESTAGNGYLGLYHPTGEELIRLSGVFVTSFGANGASNCRLTNLGSNINHGFITVDDAAGNDQAGIYVNPSGQGVVYGDITAAASPHPARSGHQIVYAALSGPEAAAYVRGTATLVNGRAKIHLPEHFRMMANSASMTIMMTPYSIESKGLAIINKDEKAFEVGELFEGSGTYDFDWEVKAVRKGCEHFKVIQQDLVPARENDRITGRE